MERIRPHFKYSLDCRPFLTTRGLQFEFQRQLFSVACHSNMSPCPLKTWFRKAEVSSKKPSKLTQQNSMHRQSNYRRRNPWSLKMMVTRIIKRPLIEQVLSPSPYLIPPMSARLILCLAVGFLAGCIYIRLKYT